MLNLIALGVVVVSLGVIAFVAVRKFPMLRTIDPSNRRRERIARVKEDLIAQRLKRKLLTGVAWSRTKARPLAAKARTGFSNLVDRVERMEEEYRRKATERRQAPVHEAQSRVQNLLGEAEEHVRTEEYQRAEQKFIEIISHNPKEVAAYQGLGELYLAQRDLAQARESLEFAHRLAPKDVSILLDLAELSQALDDPRRALALCKQAVELEPNAPKPLDALLDISIALKEKELAKRTLERLAETNPENQKLEELREQVAAL